MFVWYPFTLFWLIYVFCIFSSISRSVYNILLQKDPFYDPGKDDADEKWVNQTFSTFIHEIFSLILLYSFFFNLVLISC